MASESKFSDPANTANTPTAVSEAVSPDKLIGTRVLEFELMAVLGAGGMSVVYRARHRVTLQEVAIKVLPPELAVHDELKARFVEEARVLARLEHPNIVSLNNFCESSGRLCLIMQFVDGMTFEQQILGAGKLPWAEVLRVGIEVCKALEYAHGQQVIHRDIKPSNVLVRSDGAVKVTDFGIARILGHTRLTSTGQTMGTVRYMSPEQVRGKVVDARSDVYSLGVTLFEALAGRTPFEGDNQFDIMQQHLNKKPPFLSSLRVTVPANIDKILQRSMEKDVRDRYQDAAAFRAELEAELALGRAAAVQVKPGRNARSSRSLALALGAAVAAAGATGGIWLGMRKPVEAPVSTVKPTTAPNKPVPPPPDPWLTPDTVAGLTLALDEKFPEDGLRVQSARSRAPEAVQALVERYRRLRRSLKDFMQLSKVEAVRKAAVPVNFPLPLTLVLVPQSMLNRAELWPGIQVKPDRDYPSRYIGTHSTLFVADAAKFMDELPYGLALHAFARIESLSNDEVLSLAEKFEAYYNSGSKE